jgi:hypothetical protein
VEPGGGAFVGDIFGVSANASESGAECVLGVAPGEPDLSLAARVARRRGRFCAGADLGHKSGQEALTYQFAGDSSSELPPGGVIEAACWSHDRRKFFELADLRRASLATEAVHRID